LRIEHLEIQNFRAIDRVSIDSNSTMVVIAGPNGCGKSCVLDEVRLAKSAYGGYDAHEFRNRFGEFQIDPNSAADMKKVLRDKTKGARIQVVITLHGNEVEHLRANADEIGERRAVSILLPGVVFDEWRQRLQASGQKAQQVIGQIESLGNAISRDLNQQLSLSAHQGVVDIHPTGVVSLAPNSILQAVWSIYEPQSVGIVDYHGPQRYFSRESLGGVHLSPGKEFQGVTANEQGELEFAVTVQGGDKHDINDLSSGEKEILFGYLRLRNSAQRHSIILLDEPELHLNPKLIQGLPQFYEKHVGTDLENQIWTVTHSDAFLREAMSSSGTKVLHMREAARSLVDHNQIQEISGRREEENAILELIGDIAGYRPGGKIVVFEGEGSEFDRRMTAKLFPAFDRKMNFVSGGNKATVRRLHQALDSQSDRSRMTFSIVDRDDAGQVDADEKRGMYTWDVYHMENCLLEPSVILDVLNRTSLDGTAFENADEVDEALRAIAEEHIEHMVEDRIRARAHSAIRDVIRLKDGTQAADVSTKVARKIEESAYRFSQLVKTDLSPESLESVAAERREALKTALHDPVEWKRVFRGRDILAAFTKRYGKGLSYQAIRDMIVKCNVRTRRSTFRHASYIGRYRQRLRMAFDARRLGRMRTSEALDGQVAGGDS